MHVQRVLEHRKHPPLYLYTMKILPIIYCLLYKRKKTISYELIIVIIVLLLFQDPKDLVYIFICLGMKRGISTVYRLNAMF